MGYDGGFTKIKKKFNSQVELESYEINDRYNLYEEMGREEFYKFEGSAVDLAFLDNDWVQFNCLENVIGDGKINNYDEAQYTLITKDILELYIEEVKEQLESYLKEFGEDEENGWLRNDILKLENLNKEFDWDNHTLVFSYSY